MSASSIRPFEGPTPAYTQQRSIDPSWDTFSPAKKHRLLKENIQNEPKVENIREQAKIDDLQSMSLFDEQRIAISPNTAGLGGVASGGIVSVLAPRILQQTPPPVGRGIYDDIAKEVSRGFSRSALTTIFSSVVLGAAAYTTVAYLQFSLSIRTEISNLFALIDDDLTSKEQLFQAVTETLKRKNASYYNALFDFNNPTQWSYLLIIQGIAFDSLQQYADAQRCYTLALVNQNEPSIKELIPFVMARSKSLANPQNARALFENIPSSSPYYRLSQIELSAMDLGQNEVFDGNTPIEFLCPITGDVMKDPVSYEVYGHSFVFERAAIQTWINNKGTCPMTRVQLFLDMLTPVENLADSIRRWRQIRLKF